VRQHRHAIKRGDATGGNASIAAPLYPTIKGWDCLGQTRKILMARRAGDAAQDNRTDF
jgi:hypothetical protein